MAAGGSPIRAAQEQPPKGQIPGMGVPRGSNPAKTGQVLTHKMEGAQAPALAPAERREVAAAMWQMGCGPTEIAKVLGIVVRNVYRYLPPAALEERTAKRDDRQGCMGHLIARIASNVFDPLIDAFRAVLGLADDAPLPEDKYNALRKALHRSPAGTAVLEQRKLARAYGAECEAIADAYRKARAEARKPLKDEIRDLRDQAECFGVWEKSPYRPQHYPWQDWDEAMVWARHSTWRAWVQVRRELAAVRELVDDAVADEVAAARTALVKLLERANTDPALTPVTRRQVAAMIRSTPPYLQDRVFEALTLPYVTGLPGSERARTVYARALRMEQGKPPEALRVEREVAAARDEEENWGELMGSDTDVARRHGRQSAADQRAWGAAAGQ